MTVVDLGTLAHVQEEQEHAEAIAAVKDSLELLEVYALAAGIMTFLTMTNGPQAAVMIAGLADEFLKELKGEDADTDTSADNDEPEPNGSGDGVGTDVE